MPTTHTLVIGAGQAGLAMSRRLTDAGIDHVVLERGRTAERWRSERWESLRLLTPNWATRLPGWTYTGPHPDGYMTADELATYLSTYAGSFDAPIEEGQDVHELCYADNGFTARTSDGSWTAQNVVVATGWCDQPRVPGFAERLDPAVAQITPSAYRRPDLVPDGRVLVVGAAATGVQIADELARAGREVVLAVGGHSRVPRRYRGMDIWWWLDQIGVFATTIDEVSDSTRSRNEGALQLVGRDDYRDLDLPTLEGLGVRLSGRLTGIRGDHLTFADDLEETTAAADERLTRLLTRIDDHIVATGLDREVLPAVSPARLPPTEPIKRLHARRDRIAAVVWATGYRRSYPWLRVPVLDSDGEIVQRRGITPVAGLYVLGQRFQHRRDSNFIDGVRHDATYVARHIASRQCHPTTPSLSREDAS
ncbi:MAG TPA: NAD(P)/FAD-dependent oxidoreductase [Ilumatobacteraceae bacterium]|nr:NAD(P)/FAD-dependent oxidoreductase [Ilumatobacteraceae bacterium]